MIITNKSNCKLTLYRTDKTNKMKKLNSATLIVFMSFLVLAMLTVAKAGPLQKKPTWIDEARHLRQNKLVLEEPYMYPRKVRFPKITDKKRRGYKTAIMPRIVRLKGKTWR
jgi:transposase